MDIHAGLAGIDFLAYSGAGYGVTLACGDPDNDGRDEIITLPGPQPGAGAHLRSWNADAGAVTASTLNFLAFDPWTDHGGRATVLSGP